MTGGNDRRSRPTIPFDSQKLAQQSEEDELASPFDQEVDFALVERPSTHPRVVAHPARMASGTTPPQGVQTTATESAPPLEARSRTSTVHDPLTTSVLAEIARRSQETQDREATDRDDDDITPTDRPRRR
jgi:hypothetical protein